MVGRMSPGMRQVVWFVDRSTGGDNFGANVRLLWRSCAKVREPSELRFGVVRGRGGDAACSQITSGHGREHRKRVVLTY